MSDLSEALDELQEAKTEATGKEEFVLLAGRKKAALVSEITIDDSFISGGTAQVGGFRVSIAQSILPKEPEQNTAIECRGRKLVVMSCVDTNGVTWEIVAGDPSVGER